MYFLQQYKYKQKFLFGKFYEIGFPLPGALFLLRAIFIEAEKDQLFISPAGNLQEVDLLFFEHFDHFQRLFFSESPSFLPSFFSIL